MKKIISIFVLFLVFSLNTNAQEKNFKKVDEKMEAQKNLDALTKVLTFDAVKSQDFFRLFEYKYRNLNKNLAEDEKKNLTKIIEMKIRASVTSSEMDKIEKTEGLLKKLTN